MMTANCRQYNRRVERRCLHDMLNRPDRFLLLRMVKVHELTELSKALMFMSLLLYQFSYSKLIYIGLLYIHQGNK